MDWIFIHTNPGVKQWGQLWPTFLFFPSSLTLPCKWCKGGKFRYSRVLNFGWDLLCILAGRSYLICGGGRKRTDFRNHCPVCQETMGKSTESTQGGCSWLLNLVNRAREVIDNVNTAYAISRWILDTPFPQSLDTLIFQPKWQENKLGENWKQSRASFILASYIAFLIPRMVTRPHAVFLPSSKSCPFHRAFPFSEVFSSVILLKIISSTRT